VITGFNRLICPRVKIMFQKTSQHQQNNSAWHMRHTTNKNNPWLSKKERLCEQYYKNSRNLDQTFNKPIFKKQINILEQHLPYLSVYPGLVKSIWSPWFGLHLRANFTDFRSGSLANRKNLNEKRLFVALNSSMSSFEMLIIPWLDFFPFWAPK